MDVLKAENINIAYGARVILANVSLTVRQGETLIIAGLSGCGKTSLCYALTGLLPGVIPARLTGHISLAVKIGMVFQDADSQIICTKVEDELAFGLENLGQPAPQIRQKVDVTLQRFGLTDLRLQNPALLSGGQKRLLTLASIMILDPQILILDEPMCGLDEAGRLMVEQAIAELRDQGHTLIIVEHDLRTVTWADRWLILADGRIDRLDTPQNLLDKPQRLTDLGLWLETGTL
ncbi:MAG TPA: ABC transporter ATP-binding protein [Clostridiales bacterium]|nr:ABC transporter ATP-binding protein [Clostridiales bacterium]